MSSKDKGKKKQMGTSEGKTKTNIGSMESAPGQTEKDESGTHHAGHGQVGTRFKKNSAEDEPKEPPQILQTPKTTIQPAQTHEGRDTNLGFENLAPGERQPTPERIADIKLPAINSSDEKSQTIDRSENVNN